MKKTPGVQLGFVEEDCDRGPPSCPQPLVLAACPSLESKKAALLLQHIVGQRCLLLFTGPLSSYLGHPRGPTRTWDSQGGSVRS